MSFTDLQVKSLSAPPKGSRTYYDDTLKGFGVRVSHGGTKTFVLMVGKERARTKIGQYPHLSLAKARDIAKDLLAERQLGRHRVAPTKFGAALDLYDQQHISNLAPSTQKEQRRLATRYLQPLRAKKLGDATTHDFTKITDRAARSEGEHLHRFAKAFLRWCVRRRLLDRSPLEGLEPPSRWKSRERVLTDEELVEVYRKAQDGSAFGQIVQLLILTGQRRGQIARLRREFIDDQDQMVNWPGGYMKGKKPHSLPIMPMTAEILATLPKNGNLFPARGKDTPFNGFSKGKQNFHAQLQDVAHWTLHDLRRTFSTGLARLRTPPHVKELILAHQSAKDPVEAIYDRYTYEAEMREALGSWEAHLSELLQKEHEQA